VHTQEDFEIYTAPYKDRIWPGAVLKFTVVDETPHKRPLPIPRALMGPSEPRRQPSAPELRIRGAMRPEPHPHPQSSSPLLRKRSEQGASAADRRSSMFELLASRPRRSSPQRSSPRPVSLYEPIYAPPLPPAPSTGSYQPVYLPATPPAEPAFVIPPPPCIPPPPVMSAMPPPPPAMPPPAIPPPPMVIPPLPIIYSSSSSSIPTPVPDTMTANARTPPPSIVIHTAPSTSCCSVEEGRTQIQEMLTTFLRDFDRISSSTFGVAAVPSRASSEATLATPQPEAVASVKEESADPSLRIPGSFENTSSSARSTPVPSPDRRRSRSRQSDDPTIIHAGIICNACQQTIVGVRHKCMQCPDYDMCTPCYSAPRALDSHRGGHRFFSIDRPNAIIHSNIICDRCDLTVVGSRHKCLDCHGMLFSLNHVPAGVLSVHRL
jgi:next to BRCA1 gene 1 protein